MLLLRVSIIIINITTHPTHITSKRGTCIIFNNIICYCLYITRTKIKNNLKNIHYFIMECINRDKNCCKNIQMVFNHYIETEEKP
jgi:hypothetical protein